MWIFYSNTAYESDIIWRKYNWMIIRNYCKKELAKQEQARSYVAISWIQTTINIFSNLRHKVGADGVLAMMELHSKTSCNEDKTCQLVCKIACSSNIWKYVELLNMNNVTLYSCLQDSSFSYR